MSEKNEFHPKFVIIRALLPNNIIVVPFINFKSKEWIQNLWISFAIQYLCIPSLRNVLLVVCTNSKQEYNYLT